jgi:hypothetical protein
MEFTVDACIPIWAGTGIELKEIVADGIHSTGRGVTEIRSCCKEIMSEPCQDASSSEFVVIPCNTSFLRLCTALERAGSSKF